MSDALRPLYDPAARRFDPGRLRLAMVTRRLSLVAMCTQAGIAPRTGRNATRGERVRERTAIAILELLNASAPMDIGQDCVA